MATKKITELVELSGSGVDAKSDVLAIVDAGSNATKKITVDGLHSGSFSGSFTGDGSGLTGVISASYAVSASVEIIKEISSSHANVADFASSGNGIFSGSFSGSYEGDGTNLNLASNTTIPSAGAFPFNGDAVISGSLLISASEQTASLILKSSGSTILDVRGSLGSMFSVTDSFDGNLFEVNNISGISLLSVSSSNDVDIPKGNLTVSGGLAIEGITDVSASIAAAGGGTTPTLQQVITAGAQASGDVAITGSLTIKGGFASFRTDEESVILGSGSGQAVQASADANVIIGVEAGQGIETKDYNVIIGYQAVQTGNQVDNTVAIGYQAGQSFNGGSSVFVGRSAGKNYQSGNSNVVIGHEAADNRSDGGNENIFIGKGAAGSGTGNASGDYNIALGTEAGRGLTAGTKNVFLGYEAGYGTNTGTHNIAIGDSAGKLLGGNDANIIIGPGISGNSSITDTLIIGSGSVVLVSGSMATGNVEFNNAVTASFFKGDGSGLENVTATAFPFTGSAIISASGAQALEVIGSGSTVFSVVGSTGTLFDIDDSLEGIIFTANDSTGAPSFQVSSSGEVFLGRSPQSLYTTKQIASTISTATESIFSMTTSSLLTTLAFDYSCVSESNARAGTINSVFIPGTDLITFSETATSDIGDTSGVHLSVEITQSQAQFLSKTNSAGWRIKSIIRSI